MRNGCLLLCCFLFILSGCGKSGEDIGPSGGGEEINPPVAENGLSLSDTVVVVGDTVLKAEVNLVAKESWQITGGAEWCRVSPASGKPGNYILQIELDRNQMYDDRRTEFSIQGKSVGAKLKVKQRAIRFFNTMSVYNISDAGGEIEVDLVRSIDYDVIIPAAYQSWISRIGTRAWGSDKLKFLIARHSGDQERMGEVIFKDKESEFADTIHIIQEFVDSDIEIPDVYFRNYCLTHFDENGDGKISRKEAKKVNSMFIPMHVTSLKGIEHFIELQTLNFSRCKIEFADLSRNTKLYSVECENVGLKELKLSESGILWDLNCSGNQLKELSVSAIRNLIFLSCAENQLEKLTLGSKLTSLNCKNNKLKKLDVNACSELTIIYGDHNELADLDLTGNRKLTTLYCKHNNLKSIKFAENNLFSHLYCDYNQFTDLDVSSCTMLETLSCNDNPLNTLCLEGIISLSSLSCAETKLVEIDISSNINLTYLYLYNVDFLKTVWVWKDFVEPSGFYIPTTAEYRIKE